MALFLVACGGSTFNVQNPPPPPPNPVTIAFQPEPTGSIAVGFSENLMATVTNDPNNYGVDWTLTCQNPPNCGTLSSQHTASGTPTTYLAPASVSTNSTVVEIVALATADHSKNVVAPITITTFDSALSPGSYVLHAQGVDSSLNPYQFAGVIVLDAKGNVTAGEQTVNFFDPTTQALVSNSDAIVSIGSSYFLGSDGRGTITLQTNDTDIGTENFSFVVLSNSHALLTALPTGSASNPVLSVSGNGTMDLQASSPVAPTGGYAFVASGLNVVKAAATVPLAFGGVFNIDSANTISGNGSVADEILGRKVNPGTTPNPSPLSGTLTAAFGASTIPDQHGAFTLTLIAAFGASGKLIPLVFTGYIVDGTHVELIESDDTAGSTAQFGLTAGIAIGQAGTGNFNNSALNGAYVFEVLGTDLSTNNGPSFAPATLTSVGALKSDGSGNLSNGFTDTFLALDSFQGTAGAQISASFAGTYSVDASGTGRASVTLDNFNPSPTHPYQPVVLFYLAGNANNGNPAALVLESGDIPYHASLGAGVAYSQSTTVPVFSGDYGFSFSQELSGTGENDGSGQLNVISSAMPPLSGIADVNLAGSDTPDQPFLGSFSTSGCQGLCLTGTLVGNNNGNVTSAVFPNQIAVDYYAIDSDHGFFVETDLVTPNAPQNGQVSLGYYAVRTPVCAGCP